MSPRRFDTLRERLLRAGVAPRHVERYLRELNEHYEDTLNAELGSGKERTAAEHAAWLHLGTEDALVQSALERPELRSKAARFPGLVFGLGPSFMWGGALLAAVGLLHLLLASLAPARPSAQLLEAVGVTLGMLCFRILPVLVGVLAFVAAERRRLPAYWPLAGTALVDLLAGTVTVHVLGTAGIGVTSSLLALLVPYSGLFGPIDLPAFAEGLLRGVCMLGSSALAERAFSTVRAKLHARAR